MRLFFLSVSAFLFLALPGQALPSDEMFDTLKNAPNEAHAESIEDDILAALLESGSPTADLIMERALLAEQAGQLDLAQELLDRVVIIKPDFSEAWFRRALLFLNDDKTDQAILDINEALTHEPRNFRAWLTLGGIFRQVERNREALEAYKEVVKIHPYYGPALSEIRRLEPIVNGRAI